MESVGRGPVPAFPPFDPAALANWLGAPVAMLSEPPGRLHTGSTISHSIGHTAEPPISVTIHHRYDTDNHLDPGPATIATVRTRLRQAEGESRPATTREVIAEATVDYQLDSAGSVGISLRPSKRPAAFDEHLNRELDGWSRREVLVDGALIQWEYVRVQDFATDEEIIGCGGALGPTLVAVVGPRQLLHSIALTTIAPQQTQPEREHADT